MDNQHIFMQRPRMTFPYETTEKKIFISRFLIFLFVFSGCDSEDAPECLQAPGKIVQQEITVEAFHRVVVYGKVKLFIKQGPDQKVTIDAGENLIGDISAEVEDGQLYLRDLNTCNFFRTTYVPVVRLTVPNLLSIVNASNQTVESEETLNFSSISLVSNSKLLAPDLYSNGNFRLNLISEKIYISGDDFSNFYLSGKVNYLTASFWAGDGRLEAHQLVADSIRIFHRGTNKMILNPQLSLKGELRSTGDVISVNRPPVVQVQSFYKGKLYFSE